jgi:threonine dehydratase
MVTNISPTSGSRLPNPEGLKAAMDRISPHVNRTPLLRSDTLSRMFGVNVFLKIETVTEIGSFKLRGATNCVLAAGLDASSIVSSSTGNHGQGVAYAARLLDKPCNIYLPENPNLEKKRKIEGLGAMTTVVGRDLNVAKDAAKRFAQETGGLFVDDGEDVLVMEGAGTIGVEIGDTLETVDYLVVPMGGGNLIGGCAAGIKLKHPQCEVVAIQSSDAPSMHESFHAKAPVERDVHSIAECLAQRVPADLALRAVLKFVDQSFVVPDADLFSAASTLALYAHVLAEPGSASAVACLARFSSHFRKGSNVVLVVGGANLDRQTLKGILSAEPFEATV